MDKNSQNLVANFLAKKQKVIIKTDSLVKLISEVLVLINKHRLLIQNCSALLFLINDYEDIRVILNIILILLKVLNLQREFTKDCSKKV